MKPVVLVPPVPRSSLGEKVVQAVVWALAIASVLWLGSVLSFLLAPIGLGFVAFYSLNPVVNVLENRGMQRRWAVIFCFVSLLLLLLAVLGFIWPSLDAWLQETPSSAGEQSAFDLQLQARLAAWEVAGRKRFPGVDWNNVLGHVQHGLETHRRRWMETLPARAMGAVSSAGVYLLAPVIALFLLLDGARMHRALVSLVPNRHFETVLWLLHRVDRQIAGYLRGAATQALIVSLMMAVTLWGAGLPNAVLFGFIFGVVNVIPIVGPLIGASAGLLYSLMDPASPSLFVLAVCYFSVHVLDVGLVTPWVVGRTLDLHPLAIIVGLTVGGTLAGVLGMLVAIPLIAVGKAVAGTLYEAWAQSREWR